MASDFLLELDGIKGESTDKAHPGTIEILSYSWGVTNTGTAIGDGGSGGGAGRAVFQDVQFSKHGDSTSPQLFLRCASGEHIKKAVLYVRKSGEKLQDVFRLTLEDCLVTSYQVDGGGDALPTDSFSLNFAKITHTHIAANGRETSAGWDLKKNTKA